MKTLYKEKIGDFTIYTHIADCTPDGEATRTKIKPFVTPEMTEESEEYKKLFDENLEYAKVGPEADVVEDDVAEEIKEKLDAKGDNRLLLASGEYIADYRGIEYWITNSGKWEKEKIEEVGIELPLGAILQENLSKEQQEEISVQQEAERIAGLTPDQKIEEKNNKLHALAREAIMKAEEAELLGEEFDKQAWLNPIKAKIVALYA